MRLSCALIPKPGIEQVAVRAEELGYDSVWYPDSPALYGDVWIALALTAQATSRVGLGTSVLIPNLRHPAATAAAIAHIEGMAPGRLRVGLGTGFTGRRCFGQGPLTWKQMAEYITQLKGLLRGEIVEIEGKAAKLMHPTSVSSFPIETPILVAANGPRGLAVANSLADGLICAGVMPEGGKDASALTMGTVIQEGETLESERVIDAIGPGVAVVLHGAYEGMGAGVDNLPGGKGWRAEIEQFPEAERHLYVHEGHLVELTDRDRRNFAPELAGTTFTGTASELRDRAAQMEAQGVAEIVYWPMGDEVGELERMADALG
jgi:5,10-methylenetetrahydromethanopterin reductase